MPAFGCKIPAMVKRSKTTTTNTTYEQMGIAALIPGMQHMLTLMQAQLDEVRASLAALQDDPEDSGHSRIRRKVMNHYWASMTAEQRSAEMRRRHAVGRKRKHLHPRDPKHPEHEAWKAKMKEASHRSWGNLTAAQRKQRIAAALEGRKAKAVAA
jgi:hypothetical protein